jgi:S1-C subfamily serine protease
MTARCDLAYPGGRARVGIRSRVLGVVLAMIAFAVLPPYAGPARAQLQIDKHYLSAVVKVTAEVPPTARTAAALGTRREGSGIVIDDNGLVLTIGYLILESASVELVVEGERTVPARFVAYDHQTGLGLLRAVAPLGVKPLDLGDSSALAKGDQVLAVGNGGRGSALGAYVVSRREFAGWWEYLLPNAIFTSPPHLEHSGAALIDGSGNLVGVGYLVVANAPADNVAMPGNMFVPIDILKPVLGDLLARGRSSSPSRPWLGLYSQEIQGRLFVARVPPGGPAHAAGMRPGDMVLGIAGQPVRSLPDYYRKLWSLGRAGVEVPLLVVRGDAPARLTIKSIDRYDWFRLKPDY